MHFLSGIWVGLFFIYAFSYSSLSSKVIRNIVLCVLTTGILWEIFEFFTNNIMAQTPFDFFDTALDMFLDLLGGFVALFYFLPTIKSADKNNVELN